MKGIKISYLLLICFVAASIYFCAGTFTINAEEASLHTNVNSATTNTSNINNAGLKDNELSKDSSKIVSQTIQQNKIDSVNYALADNGIGIFAKNIAKTMSDIQGYNGDIDAIKQMVLKDTGAKAYGLSGGSIVDVTDSIQLSDLNGLDKVNSNDLKEFHLTLTVPASISGTGAELNREIIIYVGNVAKVNNWSQLDTALMSGTVTIIDVQSSMTNTAPNTNIVNRTFADSRPNYLLLGNGYSLDFLGYAYRWGTNTSIVHKAIIDNVDMYGSHAYGPLTMWDRNAYGSSITYRNVNYTGSQVTAAFQATLYFEGKNNIKSQGTQYISYDGAVRSIPGNHSNQAGLEAHTAIFLPNSNTVIETTQGDGLILGSYYSDYDTVATIQPSLTLEENAVLTIRTLGSSGETNSWGTAGGNVPSVISVQRNGKIDVGENANLNVETAEGTTRVPVRLGYSRATSNWTTSINLGDGSNFNVNINGPISNTGSRGGFMLQQSSEINVGNNAVMSINAKQMTTGAPVISMGQNAKLDVSQKGSLVLNKNGGTGRMLDLSIGAQFNVHDQGVTKFTSTNEDTSTSSLIYGGSGSSFIIGEKGIFEVLIKDGSGVRNMLEFGSSAIFNFANAKKIDLDSRGNINVNLINMSNPGTFIADIQKVSAWSKVDSSQVMPTFQWTPMYGVTIQYNGTTTTNVSGNSITNIMEKNFIDNYRTENFSRVVYDYIPDVIVELDAPSDNKALVDGQKLIGTANKNSSLNFYLVTDESNSSSDVLLTPSTIDSPVEDDARKFNAVANDEGKFSFDLPNDVTLEAG
ncbi:hypothetical protein A5884_003575, partial [Enterococcus sp. 7D2_DIV0200]